MTSWQAVDVVTDEKFRVKSRAGRAIHRVGYPSAEPFSLAGVVAGTVGGMRDQVGQRPLVATVVVSLDFDTSANLVVD